MTLQQNELSITKEEGKTIYISCEVFGSSINYVHWYQKKEGETLRRILYVKKGGKAVHDPNYPLMDSKDFSVKMNYFDLKIASLKKSHSADYYCASWDGTTMRVNIHSLYKNPDGIQP